MVVRIERALRETALHAGRFAKEVARDLPVLSFVLLLPLFFLALAAAGYSRSPSPPTWIVACEGGAFAAEPRLAAAMRGARHADGRPAFELRPVSAGEACPGQVLRLRSGADGALVLEGDALSAQYMAASNEVEELLDGLASGRAPRLSSFPPPYREPGSDFERFVPGMMVFAVLLLIPQTAVVVARERRRGTLRRLRLAGAGGAAYLGGAAVSQSACALAVGGIVVLASAAIGYPFGPWPALAMLESFGILVALGLGAVAFGLLVGAFARSDSAAINIGSSFTMLFVFFSGSFFAMPSPALASFGELGVPGYFALGAFDLIPATHALKALHRVFLDGGRGAFPLAAATLGLGALYFALAALVFSRRSAAA